ncbi:DNA repair protein RecN [Elongatibacter sediminis]|uniref:DNA repair protein RecN n=1 Tax=Elongatibacter sediminis TaxID=3119006 RepID=A0AAW9R586_9GAMM
MLTLLHIRDFAIIENLELETGAGFTAITGETGAGKSMLVDALGLLLGGRADSGSVRSGCDKAELIAEFELGDDSAALDWLRQHDMEDGSVCLLRRVLTSAGRSRAWINGSSVTLSQMQELGELLVEIHGQNEHIRLTRGDEQFRLLDAGDSHPEQRAAVEQAFEDWREADGQLQALDAEDPLPAGELELLNHQIEELEPWALSAEKYAALESEHRLLARGGDVVESLQAALDVLEDDESGIGHRLNELVERVSGNAGADADVANAEKALREAAINCEEARSSLQGALSRIDLSPEKLADLDARMARLHALARRHRVGPEQLCEVLERLRTRCEEAGSREERRRALEQTCARLLEAYRKAAGKLHKARARRAATLSQAVTELMQVLGMEGGVFEMHLDHDPEGPPSRRGDDRIELRVSANPGLPPGPLKKIASGGELSRISLAVKVAASADRPPPTQVFDEVDAGIGGETANAVGHLLRSAARDGQALCVTHLAQVAVCADRQVRVLKSTGDEATRVRTHVLDEDERVDEIARMLGGNLSEQSRAHAQELLHGALTRH